MNGFLQRVTWHGEPKSLGEVFTLTKSGRRAVCELWSHQFGWELRLYVGQQTEIVQSQVCRTEDDVFIVGEAWKAEMTAKGWS